VIPGGPTFTLRFQDTPEALVATVSANQPKLWALSGGLESFVDALTATGPAATGPADKFEVPLNVETGGANNVVFQWTAPAGAPAAAGYNLQIALDSAFTQIVFGDPAAPTYAQICALMAIVGPTGTYNFAFQADTTYYWRIRVSDLDGVTEAGTDLHFWSAYSTPVRSFRIGALAPLKLSSPASGAVNVPVMPTFVWTPITGATTYEIIVSDDPTFAIITFSRTSTQPVFAADEQLAYNTVYYWRVRASAPADRVTTFQTGVFTTEMRPTTTAPPITVTQPADTTYTITVPPSPEVIPAYLLWIIIGIGAILVIALIVLIVRTRRVS